MPRCLGCGFSLPDDRYSVGARCPNCREPLFQQPGRMPRDARPGEAVCSIHPASVSIGICSRCGNFLCETCRTRSRDQILCPPCIERTIFGEETTSIQKRRHFRQAAIGLTGGITAWILTAAIIGLSVLIGTRKQELSEPVVGLIGLGILSLLFASVIVALFGIGFSASVLRMRGDSMILATLGLLLSGLHTGSVVGAVLFAIWFQ